MVQAKKMSGGSYDYAYSRLEDHGRWESLLTGMATRMRTWAMDPDATKFVKTIPDGGVQRLMDPLDTGDRAKLMRSAHRLDLLAREIAATHKKLVAMTDILHDVEWVASGDSDLGQLVLAIAEEEEKRKR